MSEPFFTRDFNSVDMTASIVAQVCATCARPGDPDLIAAARPICRQATHDYQRIVERAEEGEHYIETLDPLIPTTCGRHLPL